MLYKYLLNERMNEQTSSLEMLKKVKYNSDGLLQTDMDTSTIWIVKYPTLQLCNDSFNYYFTDSR